MIGFACILLLAASRIQLVDEVYRIPASDWRYVELGLKQRAALVSARYETGPGSHRVRLALLRRDDLEKLRNGLPHGTIEVTAYGAAGALGYQLRDPGAYVLVIDNEARAPAFVHLTIWLDFGYPGPPVTQLTPQRQLTVVAISFLVFFAIAGYSARRLLDAVRKTHSGP
jgi:hypothetical protein